MSIGRPARRPAAGTPPGDGYRWIALSNTTMAVFMSALDGSIVMRRRDGVALRGRSEPIALYAL